MRKRTPVITVTAILSLSPMFANAATTDNEISILRQQLMALSDRLDALEEDNRALKEENLRLEASIEGAVDAVAELERGEEALEARADQSSWAERVRLAGDFRFRHETIEQQGESDRRRDRIRARASVTAQINDDLQVGLGFASGSDDPVSSNQTLGGGGTTKDINLDMAYFDWEALENIHVVGGKYKNPLYRPGKNGLIWDGDWRPEGIAVGWDNDQFFLTALGTWLESDNKKINSEFSYGLQGGFIHAFESADLTIGGSYFEVDTRGKGSFFGDDDDFFGNSYDPLTNTYLYDYQVIEVFAELAFDLADRPFSLFLDYAHNQDAPVFDTAYAVGAKYGSTKQRGQWQFGYVYQDIEADAVFGLLNDSDFGGGGTDAKGHILKGAYVIQKNWTANFTYFINTRFISDGDERDFDRMQLDLNFKY